MVIRAAGYDFHSSVHQAFAKRLGIVYNPFLICPEFIGQGFFKAYRLCRNDMHQRAALDTGENRFIKIIFISRFLIAENQTAPWSAQCLVRRRGHHIRIRYRAWMEICRHQTGNMGHIHHQNSSHFIRHFPEFLKVNRSCICGSACNNHLRFRLKRDIP